jgi:hypothetical protein
MTGMELYVKFMFTLTVGLVGVSLVMMTLIEALFSEWDPVVAVHRWWRHYHHGRSHAGSVRAEDILSELEARRQGRSVPPPPARSLDRRREVLREMREADLRVSSPSIVEAL